MTKQSSDKSICQWLFQFRGQYPPVASGWYRLWPTLSAYVYSSEDPRAGRNCKKEPTSRQGNYCYSHFTDESFHFPLKVFLAGSWSSLTPPTSYMCPFGSSYLPLLLLIAFGCEQQFWDKVPLSHPLPSWQPWKVWSAGQSQSALFFRDIHPRTGQNTQYKMFQCIEASEWQRQYKCKTHSV